MASFYLAWLILVGVFGYLAPAVAHWRMGLVMILGSIVAGSTPMGGGTVAFPVLVLLLQQPTNLGRNFAMAIQALGMTSAMIFILCRKMPIQTRMLLLATPAAAAGLLLGTYGISPFLPPSVVKLLFASVWLSFGILSFVR